MTSLSPYRSGDPLVGIRFFFDQVEVDMAPGGFDLGNFRTDPKGVGEVERQHPADKFKHFEQTKSGWRHSWRIYLEHIPNLRFFLYPVRHFGLAGA